LWLGAVLARLNGGGETPAILRNSAWLVIDKILRLGIGLLVSAWVARYLGPSEFGELAYSIAYLALFQAVGSLGLDGIVVREIAQNRDGAHAVLGTVLSMRAAAGFLCWIVAVGGMALVHGLKDASTVITAIAGGILLFQTGDTIDLWFQSQSQSRRTVVAKLIAYFLSSALRVGLILIHAPLIAFAWVLALDALASAIALVVAYRRYPSDENWVRERQVATRLLHESWPFILSGISIMIYMRIDQVMIREMLGARQLGIFAAVLPLATLWQFIPMTLTTSLAPFVARRKAESDLLYWNALSRIFKSFAILGWAICIPTALIAPFIVHGLFGSQYSSGSSVLAVYVFTNLFINMGLAQTLWTLNERRAYINLTNTIAGAAVCVLGNWLAIPRYGIVGVAAVAVFSQAVSTVFINAVFSRAILVIQLKSLFFVDEWRRAFSRA
jgi:PST family polysaccharide transporter